MRDPARIKPMIAALEELWLEFPDTRLCQLVLNASGQFDPFYVEDGEMLERIRTARDLWRQNVALRK